MVNLGSDADTTGAVVGALAGATYGLAAIPPTWRETSRGEWPLRSGERWDAARLTALAGRLAGQLLAYVTSHPGLLLLASGV